MDNKEKNSEPTPENIKKANEGVNIKDRDFQRTEEDVDNISKSEKDELEERKERTHFASTKPDKNHVG